MWRFVFLYMVACFSTEGIAQDSLTVPSEKIIRYDAEGEASPVYFNEEKLNDYKNDEAFNYTEATSGDTWWERFKRWLSRAWFSFWDWLLGGSRHGGFWAFIITTLPYLILAGILIFIVWLFYRLNPGARILQDRKEPEVFFTEEEELIKTGDIRKLLQVALQNKDYRLAVRYYYLLILKKLTYAEIISYEFDKTNNDYIAEISSEIILQQFKKATLLYDYIWYGSFSVTEADFSIAQQTFTTLEHQIPGTFD